MEYIPLICWLLLEMNSRLVVVWDWNGTLVDDSFVFVEIMNGYLSSYGLKKISLEDYQNNFCFPVSQYYKRLGFQLSENEFKLLSSDFIAKYRAVMFKPKMKTGIHTILNYLKKNNCEQLVLSAQEKNLLNQSIDFYNLKKYFSGVFGLDNNFASSKIDVALRNIPPFVSEESRLLVIGDTLHDFDVARAVGAECCLVGWGHSSYTRLTKSGSVVVNCPRDLAMFIREIIVS